MKRALLPLLISLLFGCVPDMGDSKPLFYKRISAKDLKVDWFHYSHITNTSADHIAINYNGDSTTILATNVSDFIWFR